MNSNLLKVVVSVVLALSLAGCVSADVNGNGSGGSYSELPPIDFGPSNGE